MKIKSKYGNILFESIKETIKETLIQAVSEGADLRDADLIGADLIGADLRGADLTDAYLTYANLTDADLIGADLRGAYLIGAYLIGADLRDADLRDAYLPMYSKWVFSFKNDNLSIGCKTKTIKEWDEFFESNEEFETPRGTKEFKQIEAMYLAHKTYYEFLNK